MSQPALSAQIAQMEANLGIALFERGKGGVRLTRAGDALVPKVREILSQAEELSQVARSFSAPLTGPLRLGVIPTVGPYLLPTALPAIHEAYPDLQLFLREDLTDRLVTMISAGQLDLLLLAIDVDLAGLESHSLFSDPFHLALGAADPLAERGEVELTDLDGREVLLLDEGHCLREQTATLCEAAGGSELSGYRATSLGTITQMVAGGLGLTLLPELAIAREAAAARGLVTVPFDAEGPARRIGLAWRPSSERADEFRALGAIVAQAYARS